MPVRCCTDDAQSSLLGTPIFCALVVCNASNVITAYGFNTAFSPFTMALFKHVSTKMQIKMTCKSYEIDCVATKETSNDL